jgi:hypothetical protein
MANFRAPRMYTNVAWVSPSILLKAGGVPVDPTGWVIQGVAVQSKNSSKSVPLTLANGKLSVDSEKRIVIALTKTDCETLGVGDVEIEIIRISPAPRRPVLRFQIKNHKGLTP